MNLQNSKTPAGHISSVLRLFTYFFDTHVFSCVECRCLWTNATLETETGGKTSFQSTKSGVKNSFCCRSLQNRCSPERHLHWRLSVLLVVQKCAAGFRRKNDQHVQRHELLSNQQRARSSAISTSDAGQWQQSCKADKHHRLSRSIPHKVILLSVYS